ncbi:hypothetical protein UT300011_13070 [Clostridium perfringens]|nr:hypothetical protein CPBEC1_17870 [Clostridium perfringens]
MILCTKEIIIKLLILKIKYRFRRVRYMLGNIVIYLNYVILVAIIVGGIALVVASSKKHEHK